MAKFSKGKPANRCCNAHVTFDTEIKHGDCAK